MMPDEFQYDVFLSHSSTDKAVVRPLAERLRKDGVKVWFDEWALQPGDTIPAKIEEGLEHSRVLVLCMSANAFGSDWAQLESGTFRFRDPLNKERRFIPLRLDGAPLKGSLAQFLYINWIPADRYQEYPKLLEACRRSPSPHAPSQEEARARFVEKIHSLGHTEAIRSVAYSHDGRCVLSASDDRTVRVWEVESGRCLRVLEGHYGGVNSVAWSGDDSCVLSGSDDKTVRVWDMASGKCLRVLNGHVGGVNSVAWSRDARQILSGSKDKTLRIWEAESGQCLRVLEGHATSVWSVAWNSDGSRGLSGSSDHTVRVWDTESGRCLRVLEGHVDDVNSVAWSGDNSRVLSGSDDRTVRIWEVESGICMRVLEGHFGGVNSVAWSGDGHHALSGSDDRTVRIWEFESGRCLRVLKGHVGWARSVAWSGDSRRILSGSDDRTVRVWEVESGICLRVLEGHAASVNSVAWSGDGRHALSGSSDYTVRMWEMESGRCLCVFEGHAADVNCVAWSDDGRCVLSGSDDGTVRVWEVESGRCLRVLEGHGGTVNSVAWSSDGRRVLSGSEDRRVRVWEMAGGYCSRVLEGHAGGVNSVAWSGDGSRALSGADDGMVLVWEVENGNCQRVLKGHAGVIRSVAWSCDCRHVLSGSSDKTVRVWKVETGRCLRVLEGHAGGVNSVAWSGDGNRVLSGSIDRMARVWEVASGRCLRVLGHSEGILSVAWSGDGSRAFSGVANGVLCEWDLSERGNGSQAPYLGDTPDQVQYTNAKVLLVGESGVGKTGLSNYLAHDIKVEDDKPLPSTDGAWATHWLLRHEKTKVGVEREIWLWDFAGQVDYRLVHQLFMDDTAAAVLVFNPQNENPFEGLGHWNRDLQKATRKPFAKLLAAARIDRGGLVVSASSMKKFMGECGFLDPLHETSAKTGKGCDQLREAIVQAIDWQDIPETTSPVLYHRMKQEILSLRDSGFVLIRLAELKQRMEMTLHEEYFGLTELEAVVSLLAGPGMIMRLDFGGFILLRPEVLSRYAAAVVRKVRTHPQELGCIREDELLAGDLDYQDFKRLPREDEAVVLRALLETFISRAWCMRQPCGDSAMLTFPSYFRRERKEQPGHPSVMVTYRFDGAADDIYATLVVRLHHTLAFESTDLWKSAADFTTQTKTKLGFMLTPEPEGSSRLEVYFEPNVDENSRVLFLRYVHEHLMQHAQNVVRLRHYACNNRKCDSRAAQFTDQAMIDRALAPGGKGKVFCPDCGKPIPLHDTLENKFESPAVKEQVRRMESESDFEIDNESRELQAVHHTGFIVAEAGQIYRGYTNSDHGIDGEIEFKDDRGRASGKRLYVQLKSGESYLKTRQRDGAEVFQIKKPRWVDYWQQQPCAVMLVIRTSDGEIRWMNVSNYLKRETAGGNAVKQIVFEGERLDVMSVRRWRDELLK